MTQAEKEEEKNMKCSFCGNDAFCEQCKAEPSKAEGLEHMCYDCYQKMGGQIPENVKDRTHVCIPPEKLQENFERFIDEMTNRAFMELWNAEKKKLKELSKQELSQASFFEGARFMWHFMQRMSAESPQGKHEHTHEDTHEHTHEETHEHVHEHTPEEKKE